MKLEAVRVLRGANIWGAAKVIETHLSLESVVPVVEAQALRSASLLAPTAAVRDVLTKFDVRGADWPSLLAGLLWALQPRVAESAPLELVRIVAIPETRRDFRIVVPYLEEAVGTRALDLAFRWLRAIVRGGVTPDVATEHSDLVDLDETVRLGPSTAGIVRAAEARGIPVRRLNDGSLVQLGFGARQRRIWAAETDATSRLAESIAQDKDLTKQLLLAADLPVPEGVVVHGREHAWTAAQLIGLPVVVKPRNGNQGKGVSVHLSSEMAIKDAYDTAAAFDGNVLIERHVEGADYRLLVVGNRLVAAARRDVPMVVGDGQRSIVELVALENLNPLRADGHAAALSKLRLDTIADEVLAEQGFRRHSVPLLGQRVLLRRNANLSTGGTATDVTESVHVEVARAAIDAARVVGLDIAGIDVVARTLSESLTATRGAIVEVNAAPGLRMHLQPSGGRPQPVGEAIVERLFPASADGRVPVVAVTGTNGKTTTTRAVTHLLRSRGKCVGMTCTDGVYVADRRVDTGDCSGPKSARLVLSHPEVEAAVLETARGGILREGLGFDWCDVAIVTNLGSGDHLGLAGINTVQQLAHVKGTIVRRVRAGGAAVLNAEDPAVVELAATCPAEIVYFAKTSAHPVVRAHLASGGRAVVVRDGRICWLQGEQAESLGAVHDFPLTGGGVFDFQTENLLGAAAAGWVLGFGAEHVASALLSFASDLGTVPGRMNVVRHNGSTIVLDYGHNASALLALTSALGKVRYRHRSVVYTAAGDRRDCDIREQAQILADFFDQIFIYEDQCTRGRKDGEIMSLMRDGFRASSRAPDVVQASGEFAAIEMAIRRLQPGDVLLCQIDQVDAGLEFVSGLLQRSAQGTLAPEEASNVGGWLPQRVIGLL